MAIEAVVFDVGGVLCPNPVDEFGKVDDEYALPSGTVQSFLRGGDTFRLVETGRLPIAEFYAHCTQRIATEHGVRVPPARLEQMLDACMGTTLRPEMLVLVEEIKRAGHQTGLLTNIFAERREWLHALFADGVIDVYCDSSELGLRKPDQAIYVKLLELLGRPAGEVAFVDDFAENVAAARVAGIAAIHFRDAAQARRELAALGVRISGATAGRAG